MECKWLKFPYINGAIPQTDKGVDLDSYSGNGKSCHFVVSWLHKYSAHSYIRHAVTKLHLQLCLYLHRVHGIK